MSSPDLPDFLRGKPSVWLSVLRAAFVILLGVFLARAHDVTVLGPFHALVALALTLLCARVDEVRKAAMFGWLLGIGYFGWTLRWIVEPFLVDIARHGWMAPFAIALMAAGLALFWAAAFGVARWLGGRKNAILWIPVTLTLAELARGHVLSGFPWGLLSYSMIGSVADVWLAWIGSYGSLFVLLVFAAAIQRVFLRDRLAAGAVIVATIGATLLLNVVTPIAPDATDRTVRIVQPNATQNLKWDRDWMPVFFERALELTRIGEAADVVIWPETSIPSLLNYADPLIEQMSVAARGGTVVAGIQRRDGDSYYNSAIVIDGPQTVSAIADKSHLVPFGEYIPLAWLLRPLGLGTLVDQVAGFTAGSGTGLVEIDGLGVARILICYEGIFPEEIQVGDVRPDVLLIITNDAWFGTGPGPRQHLVQAQARAIEQGLPVLRAANTGISAVIDARGAIADSLPLNEAGRLDALVPAGLPPTLYAKIGDWPLLVLLLICIAAGVARRKPLIVDGAPPQV